MQVTPAPNLYRNCMRLNKSRSCQNTAMDISLLDSFQWTLCCIAALSVGIAKTGVPGFGIVAVPLFATALGGLVSVGALLPILIFADCFAVLWYRRHAQWDKLVSLLPWVYVGILMASALIYYLNQDSQAIATPLEPGAFTQNEIFNMVIGLIVLSMLAVYFLRKKFGDKLTPHNSLAVGGTGIACGVSTLIANAAGPIMTLYLAGKKMPKEQFMGTNAWYFLILNVSKVPIYLFLPTGIKDQNMITMDSFLFDLYLFPIIFIGVFIGKWALIKIPQQAFDIAVVVLAGLSALKLLLSPWI